MVVGSGCARRAHTHRGCSVLLSSCFGGGLCVQGEGWREGRKRQRESGDGACSRAGAGAAAGLARPGRGAERNGAARPSSPGSRAGRRGAGTIRAWGRRRGLPRRAAAAPAWQQRQQLLLSYLAAFCSPILLLLLLLFPAHPLHRGGGSQREKQPDPEPSFPHPPPLSVSLFPRCIAAHELER